MARPYLSNLAHPQEREVLSNETPAEAMNYIHDILNHAAEESLDVSMMVGSLRAEVRDRFYRETTGVSFAESVRDVLRSGGDVRILIWNQLCPGLLSPEMIDLLSEVASTSYGGKLSVRISGTNERAGEIPHFLIAKRRDNERWFVRIEVPHPPHAMTQPMSGSEPPIPAVILRAKSARAEGEQLLRVFNSFFDAAGGQTRMLDEIRSKVAL